MNKYGQLAKHYWERHAPDLLATIRNPEDFFSTLGREVDTRVQALTTDLAGSDPEAEGYLEKVGRLNMARLEAEERVMTDLVYLPAQTATMEPKEETEVDLVTDIFESSAAVRAVLRDEEDPAA